VATRVKPSAVALPPPLAVAVFPAPIAEAVLPLVATAWFANPSAVAELPLTAIARFPDPLPIAMAKVLMLVSRETATATFRVGWHGDMTDIADQR
jgi:hypothetical protein